ncbi:hypothetical protein HO173_012927 [Letharia columbiana]|uniref:Uncharacterized protein n=1 Tax=Letharia columbiana TaxID=112416 RepID=A0A8H6CJB1_9LECA|nr:uncharacterized protein HO173_012927 [Letharia columbiana]KAF6224655.1 hypothetical protein HO173_012927 [Letharia columbiana]
MFKAAVSGLAAILERTSWVRELAGILPLSALIEFIDVPQKLHILELSGAVPLWSWPVTPAGSRLLLSNNHLQQSCCLDAFGSSVGWIGLDGRFGDQYTVISPETIRLCLSSKRPRTIENSHKNMAGKNLRVQNLEIVHVCRLEGQKPREPSEFWLYHLFLDPWWMYSRGYLAVSVFGWIALLGTIIMSCILQCYLALAFLVIVPLTGSVVLLIHGSRPRGLLIEHNSPYNRLIVTAEHLNATNWIVFYGESTIVNSLLNRALELRGPKMPGGYFGLLRKFLRISILGQWALALGAASTKDWNAYFISFWIAFCIFSHAYLVPPRLEAKDWMKTCAHIQLERYQTQLSSRRALLNTIMALNPDTIYRDADTQQDDRTNLYEGAMKWIDPILQSGPSRSRWEEATRKAMNEAERFSAEEMTSGNFLSAEWKTTCIHQGREEYWSEFIPEGIYMAAKIKEDTKLPGRMKTVAAAS